MRRVAAELVEIAKILVAANATKEVGTKEAFQYMEKNRISPKHQNYFGSGFTDFDLGDVISKEEGKDYTIIGYGNRRNSLESVYIMQGESKIFAVAPKHVNSKYKKVGKTKIRALDFE